MCKNGVGIPGASHWRVVEILVESAAIYSVALASLLGTYIAGSNAQYVCLAPLQPLVVRISSSYPPCSPRTYSAAQGVVFTLIIIRVGLGYTMDHATIGLRRADKHGLRSLTAQGKTTERSVAINVDVSVSRLRDADIESYRTDSKDADDKVDLESQTLGHAA